MADPAAVAVIVVSGKTVFGGIGRVPRIAVPVRRALSPVIAEIGAGMIAVDHVGEGRDQDTEVRPSLPPQRAHEERDRILLVAAGKACSVDPAWQIARHREGRRLLREQPVLLDVLSDRSSLEAMPDGSFGRAYLAHIDRFGLDPFKLIEIGRAAGGDSESDDPDIRWASERGSLAHDLWHVLTGYGADPMGESALLAFSWAQTGSRANALLTLGASSRAVRVIGLSWFPYVWKSWRRGRAAVCLAGLPYEKLLPRPLNEVRAAVAIEPPEVAHPHGVLFGNEY